MSHARIAIAILFIALPQPVARAGQKGHPAVEPDHRDHLRLPAFAGRQERLGAEPDPERQGQGGRPRRAAAHHRRGARAATTPRSAIATHRQCFVRDIEIKADAVFSICGQGSEGLQQVAGSAQPAGVALPFGLFARVRIFAAPFHRGPFRMLADPLRDIGRRRHDALPQRNSSRKTSDAVSSQVAGDSTAHTVMIRSIVFMSDILWRSSIESIAQTATKPAAAKFHADRESRGAIALAQKLTPNTSRA